MERERRGRVFEGARGRGGVAASGLCDLARGRCLHINLH